MCAHGSEDIQGVLRLTREVLGSVAAVNGSTDIGWLLVLYELQQAFLENLYLNKFNTLNIYSMKKVLLCVNDFNFLFGASYLA